MGAENGGIDGRLNRSKDEIPYINSSGDIEEELKKEFSLAPEEIKATLQRIYENAAPGSEHREAMGGRYREEFAKEWKALKEKKG